jgi:PqqD family protein of HPr-rel-A system
MNIEAPRLRELALSDSGFVFDPMTGHTYTVNPSGLLVLRMLKEGTEPTQMAQRLAEEFSVESGEDPIRDLQDFIMQLQESGLAK